MGKVTGFKEYTRQLPTRRPVEERINDFFEVYQPFPHTNVQQQAARCMDCGIPFCHTGCPVDNIIPDWNDLVYKDRWKDAIRVLHSTNNFPEITGRICPAPCEASCVLGINEPPVTIKVIEQTIAERAFAEGWIRPEPPFVRTDKRIAIVGSGPAGLAAAQQLNRSGHSVVVFEKNDRIGGVLRYGIPDFKLEKRILERRLEQLVAEGVRFEMRAHVGHNIPAEDLRKDYDVLLLTGGAEQPRDLAVPGRHLKGIHFAMEFLVEQNRCNAGDAVENQIRATGKNVIIIGGGDTGADCLGTTHRQKAKSVQQFEIMPPPPPERHPSTPWPLWPLQLRTEISHEEGGVRNWSVATTGFTGDDNGNVKQLRGIHVGPPPKFEPLPGTEFAMDTELLLVAMGFLGPVRQGAVEQLGLELDGRGNVATDANYMSSVPGVFAAGDMRRGQSLVVWAISEGRKAARAIDLFLMGSLRRK